VRLGVFGLTAPADVDPTKAFEWAIDEAAKLDVELIGGGSSLPLDHAYRRELRSRAAEKGLEIEPYVRSPFDLIGSDSTQARAAMIGSIKASKELGGPVLRTGSDDGRTHRLFVQIPPKAEHMKLLESNLQEAARLAESEGVVLAIENHTDFSGREWARVFSQVNSEQIRCAFDSGNGITIFCDPIDDSEALAQWTVTTHIKDMRVTENPRPARGLSPRVPFGLTGCPIGEGSIDIGRVVRWLLKESPLGGRLPLIVEPSWPGVARGKTMSTIRNELLIANLSNLKKLLQEM
jgi:sugar phosphate isomerase/epimerase